MADMRDEDRIEHTHPAGSQPHRHQETGPAIDERRFDAEAADFERTVELREEELVPQKELREVGQVTVRTEVEEFPGRLEVDAFREEVEVEHVPVGQVVS